MPYARSIGLTMLAGLKSGPAAIPNLELWLRSDSGVGLVGGAVASWADLSGHSPARDALQAVAGNRPAFTAVDPNFNNRPSLNFNGATSNRFMAGALPILQPPPGQSFTLMAVTKMTTTANQSGGIFDSSTVAATTNTAYMLLQNGVNLRSFRYPAANDLQYTLSVTTPILNFARSTLTAITTETKEIFEKSVSKGTQGQTSGPLQITQYRIGRLFQDVFPFLGDIVEIAAWSRALTNAQIVGLSSYATLLYALP